MKLHCCYMARTALPRPTLATTIAAVPRRLPKALWALLVRTCGVPKTNHGLSTLIRRGLVGTNDAGERHWLDNTARSALESHLADRDPVLWSLAHRTCARFFSRRRQHGDILEAIEHRLILGERLPAYRTLEWLLEENIDTQCSMEAARAIERVVAERWAIPTWLRYLHARVLERNGSWHEAIDVIEQLIADTTKRPEGRIPSPAALAAVAGQLALRASRIRCAKRFLQVGHELSEGEVGPSLLILEARLALAEEDLPRAEHYFRKAERMADNLHDRDQCAEARSGLGVVAMRSGNPHEAAAWYRRALPACVGVTSRAARVMANLAMALTISGGHDEAIGLFEEAIRMRNRLGDIPGVANSLAALASAREAAGDREGAAGNLVEARHLAGRAEDLGLVVEIHLLETQLALRRHDHALARAEWQKARLARRTLEHPDPLLSAMIEETQAELYLSRRSFVEAHRHARVAFKIFRKNGAHYFVARIRLFFARCLFSANRPRLALAHIEAMAGRAILSKYTFPTTLLDKRLLELGAQASSPYTAEFCRQLLGQTTPSRAVHPIFRDQVRFRVLDRKGTHLVSEREVDAIRQSPPPLLLDGPKQRLVIRGTSVGLEGKRLMVPLLLLFMERPTYAFDAQEIHRDVWGNDAFDDSAALRVRVALSRLRVLLGRDVVVTLRRTTATGKMAARYMISETVDYVAIELTLVS